MYYFLYTCTYRHAHIHTLDLAQLHCYSEAAACLRPHLRRVAIAAAAATAAAAFAIKGFWSVP